jgi:5'-3' exonuclease
MAGDASDNLPGIKGAGLKTIAKRFPFLIREDEYVVADLVRECVMTRKKLKIHENVENNEKLIKDNYAIMQLQHPNIRPMNRQLITKAVDDFEPFFDKIKFTQMLFADDAGHLNFDTLQYIFRNIRR